MAQTHSWDIDIAGTGDICQWITDHGGPTGLTTQDVLYVTDVRLGLQQPGWSVTTQQVLGVTDYRLGLIDAGDTNTGCDFTP